MEPFFKINLAEHIAAGFTGFFIAPVTMMVKKAERPPPVGPGLCLCHGYCSAYCPAYLGMIPVLTQAINEQREIVDQKDAEIAQLKTQLAQINARLSALENKQNNTVRKTVGAAAHSLMQNEPNPFNQSTVIRYAVADDANGVIVISDAGGKEIIRYATDASGQLEIKAGTLAAGLYHYSLMINGRVVESRQMMLTK